VSRVLTSGGAKTALEGADRIRALLERADGRIEILPGGGVREENVEQVVRRCGCTHVHLSRR
jgi:copper homeostasis protein